MRSNLFSSFFLFKHYAYCVHYGRNSLSVGCRGSLRSNHELRNPEPGLSHNHDADNSRPTCAKPHEIHQKKAAKLPCDDQQDFARAVAQVNAQVEAMLCLVVRGFRRRGELLVPKEMGEISCIAESVEVAGGRIEASGLESWYSYVISALASFSVFCWKMLICIPGCFLQSINSRISVVI